MTPSLETAIFCAGVGQLCVLVASALVPVQLEWRKVLSPLPKLVRQLFWIYGGYVVLSIVALGTICLTQSEELAAGSRLARAFCAYAALFWGIRLSLQPILAAGPHLTSGWLRCGYHLLTVLFAAITGVMTWAIVH